MDDARKKAKREKALQLARELKAKHVRENFELSSKGGRANAAEEGNKARQDKVDRDLERGRLRQEKERAKKAAREAEREAQVKKDLARGRERNARKAALAVKLRMEEMDARMIRMKGDYAVLVEAELGMKKEKV